jgi:hypothetical protein
MCTYEAYSESKYRFAVKKKLSKVLLLSDSTFFKLFFHVFAAADNSYPRQITLISVQQNLNDRAQAD